ncbi:MAG: molybdopterin-guanine dinucleotide biosynthesis protein B [Planctomycetota bacterium]|jgi:molybdopterin-guanine dinucleotide biosynthesis protein MobB
MRLENLPIFGICGWSGSGKTTLIEKAIRRLADWKLRVAVVKHDVHGINIDHPGKDSDRFFNAGADVLLQGPRQEFLRAHAGADRELTAQLTELARIYDIVLVEGHKTTPVPKVWLLSADDDAVPPEADNVIEVLPRNADRVARLNAILDSWYPRQWLRTPVKACVLMGGSSRRMGSPKHLLPLGGRTWLERTTEVCGRMAEEVVVAGAGELPAGLRGRLQLPDVRGTEGPLAGLLSAMRWQPDAAWLVVACDLPQLQVEALEWLLSARRPGVWAVLPRLAGEERIEPLLAYYDPRARRLLENLAAAGTRRMADVARSDRVITPSPPEDLAAAWANANHPHEVPLPAEKTADCGCAPPRPAG